MMNAPRPTITIIASPGMPRAPAVNALGNIITDRTTKHIAMAAIPMAIFSILVTVSGSCNAIEFVGIHFQVIKLPR